jgi:predicted dehydrogenase
MAMAKTTLVRLVKGKSRAAVSPVSHQTLCRSPIKLALLGVGRWGTHLLRNFLAQPQAEIIAVVEPSIERLQSLPQQFELPDSTWLTSDWTEALNLPGLEAVVIATPAATHYPLIRAALERGLHVLAEKPLTLKVEEAIELCELADQQQRQLIIDHTYLFHPAVQQGRSIVQQGKLGELRYGYATRTHLGPVRQDVDALWDLAVHDIAIFNHWLKETPLQVQAQGTSWLQGCLAQCPSGLADLVWIRLTYPSGFQATIHLCWANPDKQRRLCLAGSQGTLVFDELKGDAPLTLLQGRLEANQQHFVPMDHQQEVIPVEAIEPLHQVCHHFLSCIQQGITSPISSGWLGAELVQILSALTASLQVGGKAIEVSPLRRSNVPC